MVCGVELDSTLGTLALVVERLPLVPLGTSSFLDHSHLLGPERAVVVLAGFS